jgi:hypothetical protein
MIVFERLGGWGLGNSLFQIATTMGAANDSNTSFAFPDVCNFRRIRYGVNSEFKHELPWVDLNSLTNVSRWGIGDIKYVKPPKFNTDTIIDGFFQSEKYFKHVRDEVVELFSIKDEIKSRLVNDYSELINGKTCTLHVRKGDSLLNPDMNVLSLEYYKDAVSRFDDDTTFVIFSDDIQWCKDNLSFIKNKIYINEKSDFTELHLMSMFKNNIIANSTFSWWSAWLGDNNNVISPDPTNNWFSEKYYKEKSHNKSFGDLVCENWTLI